MAVLLLTGQELSVDLSIYTADDRAERSFIAVAE